MKASELRIGNVIWDEQRNKEKFVTHRVINDLASHNNPLPYKAIPLTEEWLVKFGFEKQHDKWVGYGDSDGEHWQTWVKNRIVINRAFSLVQPELIGKDRFYFDYEDEDSSTAVKNVQYVHQLQNLYFALTGEELNES